MSTISTLANEFGIQAHEVRATLDLGDAHDDHTSIDEFDGWTEAEAREVLALAATQAADRV